MRQAWWLVLVWAAALWAQEVDPEKKYMPAFAAAHQAIDASRAAGMDKQELEKAAGEVEKVLRILEETGKPPYKNAKHYKKAELKTREILRRIDTLLRDAGVEERESLQNAHDRVQRVHEKLLEGVMMKKP
ncbi:hypothetical protein WDZ92_06075 [Nostoc sp. NIES-2111]